MAWGARSIITRCSCAKKIWDTLEKQPTGWWCNVPILKHDGVRQWGWDDIPYMTWKIKAMFESTNQIIAILIA